MKRCPFCGALLAASLVDAIVDPNRDESCPVAERANRGLARFNARMQEFARELAGRMEKEGLL